MTERRSENMSWRTQKRRNIATSIKRRALNLNPNDDHECLDDGDGSTRALLVAFMIMMLMKAVMKMLLTMMMHEGVDNDDIAEDADDEEE